MIGSQPVRQVRQPILPPRPTPMFVAMGTAIFPPAIAIERVIGLTQAQAFCIILIMGGVYLRLVGSRDFLPIWEKQMQVVKKTFKPVAVQATSVFGLCTPLHRTHNQKRSLYDAL